MLRKYLFYTLALLIVSVSVASCAYAPNTAWTPRRSFLMRKQGKPKKDNKARIVKLWR
jgi:hypothetical protein